MQPRDSFVGQVLEELRVEVVSVSTSSRVSASDIEVDSGVDWRSVLMSRLTEREWFLATRNAKII